MMISAFHFRYYFKRRKDLVVHGAANHAVIHQNRESSLSVDYSFRSTRMILLCWYVPIHTILRIYEGTSK